MGLDDRARHGSEPDRGAQPGRGVVAGVRLRMIRRRQRLTRHAGACCIAVSSCSNRIRAHRPPHNDARQPAAADSTGLSSRGRPRRSETTVPPVFIPTAPVAASLFGDALVSGEFLSVEVDFATGEVRWQGRYSRPEMWTGTGCDEELSGPTGFATGVPTPRGGMLFRACRGRHLVWLADRDDDQPTEVAVVPTYRRTLPTEAEVDGFVWSRTQLAGGAAPPASDVEAFRNRPRSWYKSHIAFDGGGRAWMATRRTGGDFSYIDVHDGIAYRGTVRVRHSLIELDIVGSLMVVLVDRPLRPNDPAGIPRRGIDWYDIAGVDFGTMGGQGGPEGPSPLRPTGSPAAARPSTPLRAPRAAPRTAAGSARARRASCRRRGSRPSSPARCPSCSGCRRAGWS